MGNKPSKGDKGDKKSVSPEPVQPQAPRAPPPPEKMIFGVSLDIAAQRSDPNHLIPSPITSCIAFIEKKGIKAVGIYRISGSLKKIQDYIYQYNCGQEVKFPDEEDIHCVVGVLKSFLRELPEPIFTNEARKLFRDAGDIHEDSERIQEVKKIVDSLPACNRESMKLLSFHLAEVSKCADINKMTPSNLTISLCPELGEVFTTMIEHVDKVFGPLNRPNK